MNEQRQLSRKLVCATCLEDEVLKRIAHEYRMSGTCDYCGKLDPSVDVVRFGDVVVEMKLSISREWHRPIDGELDDPLDEYLSKCHDSQSLFKKIDFSVSNSVLMDDFVRAFGGHSWCRKELPYSSASMKWADEWEAFKNSVKHQRRYTFWQEGIVGGKQPTAKSHNLSAILYRIKALLNKSGLVRAVKPGTLIWRVQVFAKTENPSIPNRFTSPPIKYALQPNRMSPAGVPMFYGADDFKTAYREVVDPHDQELKGKIAMGVQFRAVSPLKILDLTASSLRPSYFRNEQPANREVIAFLRAFAEDLSMPIGKVNREQIDYVPTQVFTEFVRYVMRGPNGAPIHGIQYFSSWNEMPCYVIFATQAQCLPPPEPPRAKQHKPQVRQLLKFVPGSLKAIEIT